MDIDIVDIVGDFRSLSGWRVPCTQTSISIIAASSLTIASDGRLCKKERYWKALPRKESKRFVSSGVTRRRSVLLSPTAPYPSPALPHWR